MIYLGPVDPLTSFPPVSPEGKQQLFFKNFEDVLKTEDWENNDYPRQWVKVEENKQIIVYIDAAYGAVGIAEKENPKEIKIEGKHFITMDKFVILDKDYYGTTKYIWT